MLGRKTDTQEEIDHAKAAIDARLDAYRALAGATAPDAQASTALDAFEPLFFNALALALDRPFVHRIRKVTGKDGDPLNEVELVVDYLMHDGGVLLGSTVIEHVPEESVLGLRVGDPIRLDAAQFERLAAAFFAELEARFLEAAAA